MILSRLSPSTSSMIRSRCPSAFFDVVNGDDIGVVEGCDGFGLALEALEAFGILGHGLRAGP